ncbi:MAG TPA: Hpt domain-containing protein, partial [Gaiellaceae bacterium]|nr:Hpt domain-containing protein [Gaiellaceae bacterium]
MSGAASEHQALLASFAAEIEPLLAMLAGALDRLVERPDDATAATIGRAQVQTLQGAASMLELTGFVALLGLVREALDLLATSAPLGPDARAAASELAALILREGEALGRGTPTAAPPATGAALLERLRAAPPPRPGRVDTWASVPTATPPASDRALSEPLSLEAWLDTITADLAGAEAAEPAVSAIPPAASPEAEPRAAQQPDEVPAVVGLSLEVQADHTAAATAAAAAGAPADQQLAAAPSPVAATTAGPTAEHERTEAPAPAAGTAESRASTADEDTWPGLAAPAPAPAATDAATAAASQPPSATRPVTPDDTTEETIRPEAVRALIHAAPPWAPPAPGPEADPPPTGDERAPEPPAEPAGEPSPDLLAALATLGSPPEPPRLDEGPAAPPPAAAATAADGLQELLAGLAEVMGEPLPADELAALGLGAQPASSPEPTVSRPTHAPALPEPLAGEAAAPDLLAAEPAPAIPAGEPASPEPLPERALGTLPPADAAEPPGLDDRPDLAEPLPVEAPSPAQADAVMLFADLIPAPVADEPPPTFVDEWASDAFVRELAAITEPTALEALAEPAAAEGGPPGGAMVEEVPGPLDAAAADAPAPAEPAAPAETEPAWSELFVAAGDAVSAAEAAGSPPAADLAEQGQPAPVEALAVADTEPAASAPVAVEDGEQASGAAPALGDDAQASVDARAIDDRRQAGVSRPAVEGAEPPGAVAPAEPPGELTLAGEPAIAAEEPATAGQERQPDDAVEAEPAAAAAPEPAAAEAAAAPAASPILDYLGSVAASVDSLLDALNRAVPPDASPEEPAAAATTEPLIDAWEQIAAELAAEPAPDAEGAPGESPLVAAASDSLADVATGPPAGVDNAEALAVFAGEQGRLVEALARARAALDAAPDDEAALMDLAWATHTLRGAASLVGADAVASVCGRIEQATDRLAAGLPAAPAALAFLATAEETLRAIVAAPPDAPDLAAALELLDLQLGEWQAAGSTEAASATDAAGASALDATAWGDLPPELLVQLEGVDLATVDDETLGRLAALLDAAPAAAPRDAASAAAAPTGADETLAAAPTGADEAPAAALPPLADQEAFEDWALPTDVAPEPWTEPAADDLALDDADFEAEVRAVFLAEAEEHLATINQALLVLEASPGDQARLIDVRRAVHTLKSASAAVGLEAVSDFCHVWEDALEAVEEGDAAAAPDLSLLLECAEALERYFRHVDDPAGATAFVSLAARLAAFGGPPREAAPRASLAPRPAPDAGPFTDDSSAAAAAAGDAAPAAAAALADAPLPFVADAGWEPAAATVGWEAALPTDAPAARDDRAPAPPAEAPPPPAAAPVPARASAAPAEAETVGGADVLRVPLRRVDGMIDLVGELVVQRSGLVQRLERLGLSIEDLAPSLQRLRRLSLDLDDRFGSGGTLSGSSSGSSLRPTITQGPFSPADASLPLSSSERAAVRTPRDTRGHVADFDELELDRYGEAYQLARELAELAADLDTTRRELRQLLDDAQLAVFRSVRVTADLHDALLDARLVPLAQLGARLQRTVRQAALKSGKEVSYALEGGDTLLDKTLLEAVADPLLHLLRNAVDHGIEPPDERRRRGKPTAGAVRVCAWRDGQEVVIQVRDDGAGIDPARVIARARARGLVPPDAPADAALAYEL